MDYGHSFKNGHEVVTQTPLNFITDKPRTSRFIKNEVNSLLNVNYGNYILVKNLNGYFDIEKHETVYFYNKTTSVSGWNTTPNLVGTAKIRYFDLDHGRRNESNTASPQYPEYRAYLYNFKSINAGEPRSMKGVYGHADTSVELTTLTGVIDGNINIATANVYSQLHDTGVKNKALFELQPNYVQHVSSLNSEDKPIFYTIRDFPAKWVRTTKTLGGVVTNIFELRNSATNNPFVASDFGSELNNGLVNPANEVDLVESNYTIYNMNSSHNVTIVCDSISHTFTIGMIVDPDFIAGETNCDYKWTTDTIPKLSIYYASTDTSVDVIDNQKFRVKLGINSVDADVKTYSPVNITTVKHTANTSHQGYDSSNISFFESDIYSIDAIYMAPTGNTTPLFPEVELDIISGSFLKGEKIYEINSTGLKTGIDGCLIENVSGNTWSFIVGSGHINGEYFSINNTVRGVTSKATAAVKSSVRLNAGSNDITDRYTFDSGQRDNYYDWSKITLKSGKPKPTGALLIAYSKFITDYSLANTKTFFTLNSYGSFSGDNFIGNSVSNATKLSYSQLPTYSSHAVGNLKLRDCIDFRPIRHANTTVTLYGDLSSGTLSNISNTDSYWLIPGYKIYNPSPYSTDHFEIDYSHFVDKRCVVSLTSDYKFGVFEGIPGGTSDPSGPSNSTPYWKLYFPPYLDDISLVQKTYVANKTYTMKDVGDLDSRITNLEKTVSLTVSELQAITTPIPSMSSIYLGLERFKNGILMDTFAGSSVGNVTDPDYKCSIEPSTQTCRSPFTSDVIDIDDYNIISSVTYHPAGSKSFINDNGDTVIGKDGIITLNYVNIPWQSQTNFSSSISVNPYYVVNFDGKMTLAPCQDNWMDTTVLPTVNIDLTGDADAWNALTTSVNGTLTISFSTPPAYKIGSNVTSADGGTGIIAEIDQNTCVLTDFEGKFADGSTLSGINNAGATITKTILKTLASGGAPGFGTQFGDWQTNWTGVTSTTATTATGLSRTVSVPQNTITTNTVTGAVTITTDTVQRTQTGTTSTAVTTTNIATNKTQTGTTTSLSTQIVKTDLGNKVVDVSIVPYIRSNDVLFDVSGLKPNTVHYPFFNGVDVSRNCANRTLSGSFWILATYGEELKSDKNGRIHGIFKIPGGMFATGERTFRIIDKQTNNLETTKSHADAVYTALGLAQTKVDQIVSTRTPIIEISKFTTETTVLDSDTKTSTNVTWNDTPVAPDINQTVTPVTPPPVVVSPTVCGSGIGANNGLSIFTPGVSIPLSGRRAIPGTYTYNIDLGSDIGSCGVNYIIRHAARLTITWNGKTNTVSNVNGEIAGYNWGLGLGSLAIQKDSVSPSTATVELYIPPTGYGVTSDDIWGGSIDITVHPVCGWVRPAASEPLAQSFFINPVESPNGLFVTAIDVFVAALPIDNTLPLSLELRTVSNGMPSSYTLPDTEVIYNLTDEIDSASHNGTNLLTVNTTEEHKMLSGQYITLYGDESYNGTYTINIINRTQFSISIPFTSVGSRQPSVNMSFSKINLATENNGWVPTKFVFEYPIYLQKDEYCFVVKSDTLEYELYLAEMGKYSLIDGSIISKQPASGSMYKSQNAADWTSDQYCDLAFTIYRAYFDTTNTGDIEFYQDDLSLNYLAGVKGTFSSDFNVKYNILNFQSSTIELPKTSINWGIKTANVNGILDSNWSNLSPKTDNEFTTTRLITKGTELLQVRALLSTSDNYVSPIIDLLNQRAIIIENIINNTVEGEYDISGGGSQAKYISKSVILEEGMDAIDLKVTLQASRQSYGGSTSNILCYMKLLSASDETLFSNKYWYPMKLVSDPGYSSNAKDFKKYEFIPPKNVWYVNQGGKVSISYTGDGVLYNFSAIDYNEDQINIFMDPFTTPLEHVYYDSTSESITITKYDGSIYPNQVKTVKYSNFLQYAVKIVMISDNKSMVPLIKNLQAIALT